MTRCTRFAILVAITAAAACSRQDKTPAPNTDSVVDRAADVTSQAPAAATSGASKIGTLPVLTVAGGGKCSTRSFSGVTAALTSELVFQNENPTHTVKVGVGDSTRTFRPVKVEASLQQEGTGFTESETIVASFSPTGDVTTGSRSYYTSDGNVRERRDLLPDEHESARQLALQIMEQCHSS